jgi:hypothetical protein
MGISEIQKSFQELRCLGHPLNDSGWQQTTQLFILEMTTKNPYPRKSFLLLVVIKQRSQIPEVEQLYCAYSGTWYSKTTRTLPELSSLESDEIGLIIQFRHNRAENVLNNTSTDRLGASEHLNLRQMMASSEHLLVLNQLSWD